MTVFYSNYDANKQGKGVQQGSGIHANNLVQIDPLPCSLFCLFSVCFFSDRTDAHAAEVASQAPSQSPSLTPMLQAITDNTIPSTLYHGHLIIIIIIIIIIISSSSSIIISISISISIIIIIIIIIIICISVIGPSTRSSPPGAGPATDR